jgi:hypothetical protein
LYQFSPEGKKTNSAIRLVGPAQEQRSLGKIPPGDCLPDPAGTDPLAPLHYGLGDPDLHPQGLGLNRYLRRAKILPPAAAEIPPQSQKPRLPALEQQIDKIPAIYSTEIQRKVNQYGLLYPQYLKSPQFLFQAENIALVSLGLEDFEGILSERYHCGQVRTGANMPYQGLMPPVDPVKNAYREGQGPGINIFCGKVLPVYNAHSQAAGCSRAAFTVEYFAASLSLNKFIFFSILYRIPPPFLISIPNYRFFWQLVF